MSGGFEGGCLCGAVRYRSEAPAMMAGDCYCVDCRRSSGTSHCTHVVAPDTGFSVSGDLQSYERQADSGNIVSREFCPTCGSPVLSRNSGMPGMIFVRASSLDHPDAISPQMTVYASRAPAWARIDTTQPVFAEMMQGGPQAAMAGKMDA